MSNFRTIDRETGFLLPPSVDEWLPEKHLARFVVEVVDGLDLRAMSGSYRGSGSASYHPRMLLGILVYGYATGVFSSRKLERATYDSVAFRFIAANDHPDHDTIASFRRRFLAEIEALFVQVLLLAREMGVLKMGTVALDGTKIHANASRHSALSYEHAGKVEAQLKAEVADLMAKAEAADAADIPDGMSIPDELARREERLRKLAEARAKIEARAKERHAREQAEHEARLAARQAKAEASGKQPRGKPRALSWVQKAVEGAGDRRFLGTCPPSRRTSALSGRDEGEHPLDVPDHGDEAPFAARAREAAQRKLTESQRRFDDPEHRLRHLLAQRVKRPACRRLQPMRHRLDRRWILRRFRRRLEELGQRWMMRLTAHGDQRFDPRLVASRDVRRAEIARIRQQADRSGVRTRRQFTASPASTTYNTCAAFALRLGPPAFRKRSRILLTSHSAASSITCAGRQVAGPNTFSSSGLTRTSPL